MENKLIDASNAENADSDPIIHSQKDLVKKLPSTYLDFYGDIKITATFCVDSLGHPFNMVFSEESPVTNIVRKEIIDYYQKIKIIPAKILETPINYCKVVQSFRFND